MPTRIRTVAVHDVVARTYPRPPPEEKDHVAMAAGRAIDGAIAEFGHAYRQGRRPTVTSIRAHGAALLDDALAEAAVEVPAETRERILGELVGVLQAYRASEIVGLSRPHTRVILLNGEVGVYAQPDFWDGRARIYEMKTYVAVPPPPDVALQVRLFQLAFPQFQAVLVCFNRHVRPVETRTARVPPPTADETRAALERALAVGREVGVEKVLEYVEGPFVHYTLAP